MIMPLSVPKFIMVTFFLLFTRLALCSFLRKQHGQREQCSTQVTKPLLSLKMIILLEIYLPTPTAATTTTIRLELVKEQQPLSFDDNKYMRTLRITNVYLSVQKLPIK